MKTIERTRFGGKLAVVYRRQKGRCNIKGCRVYGIHNLTKDHIIPIAVAKLYGWTKEQYDDVSNIQLICVPHHRDKDRNVPKRLEKIAHRLQLLNRIAEIKDTAHERTR